MCGFFKEWICVCVCFVMCGCVYVWFFKVWMCVYVNFEMCCFVYVLVL